MVPNSSLMLMFVKLNFYNSEEVAYEVDAFLSNGNPSVMPQSRAKGALSSCKHPARTAYRYHNV